MIVQKKLVMTMYMCCRMQNSRIKDYNRGLENCCPNEP